MNRFSLTLVILAANLLPAIPASNMARAGQITLADFSPAAVVENFESFGTGYDYTTPISIGGNTYHANADALAHSSKLGPDIGRSGVAIANRVTTTKSEVGFIEITLGDPALRAGMYVGFQVPWSADVQFFSSGNNALLGSIRLNGSGNDSHFAAWQAVSGRIGRIRVTDLKNDGHRIILDDLIQEVPEPASIVSFAIGALTVVGFRRRRRVEPAWYPLLICAFRRA